MLKICINICVCNKYIKHILYSIWGINLASYYDVYVAMLYVLDTSQLGIRTVVLNSPAFGSRHQPHFFLKLSFDCTPI